MYSATLGRAAPSVFVGEEFGRAIGEAPRPAGRGAEHTISEGVERSEIGLWFLSGEGRKAQIFLKPTLSLLLRRRKDSNLRGAFGP